MTLSHMKRKKGGVPKERVPPPSRCPVCNRDNDVQKKGETGLLSASIPFRPQESVIEA